MFNLGAWELGQKGMIIMVVFYYRLTISNAVIENFNQLQQITAHMHVNLVIFLS